jgi:hypothetical protein
VLESEAFVTATKEKLGVKVKGREVIGWDGSYELREAPPSYKGILGHENKGLRLENTYSRVAWSDPPKPSRNYKLAITLSREYLFFLMS